MSSEDNKVRSEAEVVNDLMALASTPGYAHAIAAICFRDNVIRVPKKLDSAEIAKQFSDERLLRTEVSTLIGLMVKAPIDLTVPKPHALQEMIDRTDLLMKELHQVMSEPARQHIHLALSESKLDNPFTRGDFLREAIFYGGESAYLFQYRDLSVPKYAQDNDWLQNCKGFSIEDARAVIGSIFAVQNEKITATLNSLRDKPMDEWTLLPGFTFAAKEIEVKSGIPPQTVGNVLASLTLPNGETNSSFQTVSDFNITNALPMLPVGESEYLCFQGYVVAEALYESPFYWMLEDKAYAATASAHRGQFAEEYCADRLGEVFGQGRVHKNVLVYRGKTIVAEIDVLVLFADRAIIVQAKSKRLTVEARKGNDNQLRDDFKLGIQAAYDQGRSSATMLLSADTRLVASDGTTIEPKAPPSELYIFCVLSEHYPALAFQARQFLIITTTDVIKPPFVMDVFTLDAITEFLNSPLYFLSYINRRVEYADKVMSSHELTILSYHLKQNLWVEPEYDLVHLEDDISADLD
ncbi:nuclease-related domain-containing protein, partial [Candidatus Methylomirabilis sp.]|uniref:nuclease-related domain-containing protein n=1 Tax=Candidatus Methylomirabilis sp. TaxID=2032687 RepID=UPI003C735315